MLLAILIMSMSKPPQHLNEETIEEIFCEPSLKDPLEERFDQFGGDLDLDKLLYHAKTFNESSLEDPLRKRFDQIGCDLDLDKFLKQAVMLSELSLEDPLEEFFAQFECNLEPDMFLEQTKSSNEPSLEGPTEESFVQFEFDMDHYMICEQAKALLDSTLEMRIKNAETTEIFFPNSFSSPAKPFIIKNNKVEEKEEQIKPLPTPNLSNDTEVSTEAHYFVIVPFETHHETQASFLQCLKEPSYAIIFKDLCTKGHKSRNNLPKKIRLNKKVEYLRWLNILLKGCQVLKKKW